MSSNEQYLHANKKLSQQLLLQVYLQYQVCLTW